MKKRNIFPQVVVYRDLISQDELKELQEYVTFLRNTKEEIGWEPWHDRARKIGRAHV